MMNKESSGESNNDEDRVKLDKVLDVINGLYLYIRECAFAAKNAVLAVENYISYAGSDKQRVPNLPLFPKNENERVDNMNEKNMKINLCEYAYIGSL